MKRVLLLVFGLALVAGTAGADGEFIHYHHPTGVAGVIGSPGLSYASNVLSLANDGTAGSPVPQSFYVYNFCDGAACATGYERAGMYWSSNILHIGTYAAGTGTGRAIYFDTGAASFYFGGDVYPLTNDARDLGYLGTNLWRNLYLDRSIQGSKSKSLTDAAAATAYATIAVPTNGQIAGEIIWTATSSAGAVRFVANGSQRFWGVDQGGTPVCGINKIGTDGEGHSSGANTLVCTWSNAVATTNCALSVTCTNDTAGDDAITIYGRLNMPTTATVTFN